MGYYSNIRIRLTKKDYDRLVEEFEEKIVPKIQFNLFKQNYFIRNILKDYEFYEELEDGYYKERVEDCVFFGWNGLKWYDGYDEVDFIKKFVFSCKCYAYCRIGESIDGDIDNRSHNMDMIGIYCDFDEEV